jgi:hypothetical protein
MTALLADDGVRIGCIETGGSGGVPMVPLAGSKAPATSWLHQASFVPDTGCGYRVLAHDGYAANIEQPKAFNAGRVRLAEHAAARASVRMNGARGC